MASQIMLWDTEVTEVSPGKAEVVARRPLHSCDTQRALKVLGMRNCEGDKWTLYRLARLGKIRAWKPGEIEKRTDGRGSSAKWVFDFQSLLEYKAACQARRE